jgi:general secretion pathway protein G
MLRGLPAGKKANHGLTLVEVLIVLAIIAVLASIALPKYQDYRERVRVAQAVSDIAAMNVKLRAYISDNDVPPDALSVIGAGSATDPWGRPYVYLKLLGAPKSVIGQARKNKGLVPINSDFDLYSVGKDGISAGPLTAPASRDDVVRANDGRFIGLGSDYQ